MARPRLYDWDEIHRLHAQGMSPYSISKKLGCRLYTVQYALNPAPPEHRRAVLKAWRARRKAARLLPDVVTKEEVIAAIREYVAWAGRAPYAREFGTEGLPKARVAAKLFGSTSDAVRAAGYELPLRPKPTGRKKKIPKPTCNRPGCNQPFFRDYVDYTLNISEGLCREHWFEIVRQYAPSP